MNYAHLPFFRGAGLLRDFFPEREVLHHRHPEPGQVLLVGERHRHLPKFCAIHARLQSQHERAGEMIYAYLFIAFLNHDITTPPRIFS